VSTENIVECSILHKGNGLLFVIVSCRSWETALNVGLGVSFGSMVAWPVINMGGKKGGVCNSRRANLTHDETSPLECQRVPE
jgi:hypothetical protein